MTNTVTCNCLHWGQLDTGNFLQLFCWNRGQLSRIHPARLLSYQITRHLNSHIVRILQINFIRILPPGVPSGCNQLWCIWITVTSLYSKVSLDCCMSTSVLVDAASSDMVLTRVRLELSGGVLAPVSLAGCLCWWEQLHETRNQIHGLSLWGNSLDSWKTTMLLFWISTWDVFKVHLW